MRGSLVSQSGIVSSILAGSGATVVHMLLMEIKHRAGILPSFEPYDDMQRLLNSATADALQVPSWLLAYVNGALVLGFVFGKSFPYLPGRTPVFRGAIFGFAAWLVMNFVMLPVAGRGVFAWKLGLSAWPAALMLAMLLIYAVTMSVLYAWLTTHRPTP